MKSLLSPAGIKALVAAVKRSPPCVLPLPAGVQGVARTSLLNVLRARGFIDESEFPCITPAGKDALIAAGHDWIRTRYES